MFKLKTRKATAKRYKKTSTNKYMHKHAFKGHLLLKKNKRQKRHLSANTITSKTDLKVVRLMLPY